MGPARLTPAPARRSALRERLPVRGHLPGPRHGGGAGSALRRHRSHAASSRRDRPQGGARGACGPAARPRRLAHLRTAGRAEEPDARLPARPGSRTEPGRERVAVPAGQLALQPRVRHLRGHSGRRLRGLAQARRAARDHHLYRPTRLGPHRSKLKAAGIRRSQWLIGALGVLALSLSAILAFLFGRRISRSVQVLAQAARALGRGEPVRPMRLGFGEAEEVGRALAAASSLLRQRETDLRASEGRLRATHENAGVGIVQIDREGRFLYVNEAQTRLTGHTREQLLGRHFAHATHPDDLDRDYELFRRQVAGEFEIYTIEKQHVRVDGTTGWAKVSSTAVRDGDGGFLYAVRVVEDISDRKRAEARQKLLVDELNHRVKNTLMTVQSLAFQTFRQGLPPEMARERFEARLISLSRTHNLLNESHWQGARLKDILTLELNPYTSDGKDRLAASGPNIELPARTAVVLGMVFHELATNAVKYGCFSVPEGR